jgi:hypothetical protein
MKLTRRNLAISLIAAPALSARAEAQANSSPADAELAAARERLRTAANALKDHKIPMSVEPAFQFRA